MDNCSMPAGVRCWVGLDVHARTIVARGVDADGVARNRTFRGADCSAQVVEWALGLPRPAYVAYESGCTGFDLCVSLRGAGVACDVIAVSTLPRSQRDEAAKNDDRDARLILHEITSQTRKHSCVWVPPADVEGARDLARARLDAKRQLLAAQQQASAFLLRHGHVFDERTATGRQKRAWGADWLRWAGSRRTGDPASDLALRLLLSRVETLAEVERGIARACAELAATERWKPYVDALALLKGIDVQTALLVAAEFGDFSRFGRGRAVSRWLGSIPKERTSDGRGSKGHITKEGNSGLRRALVESASPVSRWSDSPKARPKGNAASDECARIARKAARRLKGTYERLTQAGKPANVAKMAVASELARWCWAVGRQVDAELARAGA